MDNYFDWIAPFWQDRFKLEKKMSISFEDGSESFDIYGSEGDSNAGKVRLLCTKIEGDLISVIQINELSTYTLTHDGAGTVWVLYDTKWVIISPLLQAKFLAGVELLKENLIDWHPLKEYKDLYSNLISYMNHVEKSE